eukprot:TRINITY_DN1271_c0_g2_i2.p1 TRINITY_DN1271_c0_g2~~TRINITY_DN1271_c0_g2_i2.p1  ORF type:complete len:577 (-),score=146.76 TRINITY_DN1271_c0_g2_i2:43-1677(-)
MEVIAKHEEKERNELFSDLPSRYMFLANFGPVSGIKQEQVISFFQKQDGFERVITPRNNRPYLVLQFSTPETASSCHAKLHTTTVDEWSDKVILLFYAKSAPAQDESYKSIPGLILIPDFITPEQELHIYQQIQSSEPSFELLNLRSVKHWGYKFNYHTNHVDPGKIEQLPPFSDEIIESVMQLGKVESRPDQLTVNVYEPGAGIPSHVETHSDFEDGVISLSLLSQTVMNFKHPDGESFEVLLPPRSLLIMTKEARFLWSHGIPARKTDLIDGALVERKKRVSLTFRKVRASPCNCPYHAQCDSWLSTPVGTKEHNTKIEDKFVKEIYDTIAPHFSDTRHKPWPKINTFLEGLPAGSLVCDVGSGNGKYLGTNPNIVKIGNDQSLKLIEIARERGFEVNACNNLYIPYRSSLFDVVLSIAVVHHFSTVDHRIQALKELTRILRPGGKLLVYVWAMEQEAGKRKFGQQDIMVPWHMEKLKYDPNEHAQEEKEVEKHDKKFMVYQRYYHVFRKGELKELVEGLPGMVVEEEGFDHANWTVIARKC